MAYSPRYTREVRHILLLLLAALVVRVIHLGRADLWQDEAILVSIMAHPAQGILEVAKSYWNIIISMAQLPLAGVVQSIWMKLWMPVFGMDVIKQTFLLRIPVAVAGTFGVLGVFLAARQILPRAAAWSAALMMAFFFFPVYYSREVYCYAYILLFGSFALHHLFRVLDGAGMRSTVWLGICLTGVVLSHLGGVIFLCAMLAVLGVSWLYALIRRDKIMAGRLLKAGLAGAVALAIVSPYFFHFLINNTAHTQPQNPPSFALIFNDSLSKMFMGDRVVWAAWLALVVGVLALLRLPEKKWPARIMATTAVFAFVMLAVATSRSQYISARYFSPLTPLFYVVFAGGFYWLAGLVFRKEPARGYATLTITALLATVHLSIFLPPYYRLTAKHEDFRSVAEWINERLEPGTPYLLESAYVLRFIGGYYPTPDNVGASPYVHGGGPGEMQRLHERQMAFMRQFPEAPFIETAHHNANTPEGVWKWPAENFARREVQINQDLRDLITFGIYPGDVIKELRDTDFRVDIFYNTWKDRLAQARARGDDVVLRYDGWQVGGQQVAPNASEYFRIAPGARSVVKLARVDDEPVTVDLVASVAVISESPSESVTFTVAGQSPVRFNLTPGQFAQIPLRGVALSEPESTLEIRHRGGSVRALLVRDIQVRRAN